MNETDVRTALDKFWNDKTCEECGADLEFDEIKNDNESECLICLRNGS